jgi:hypothetical protein
LLSFERRLIITLSSSFLRVRVCVCVCVLLITLLLFTG